MEVFLAKYWFRTLGSLELKSAEGGEITGVVSSGKLVALLAYLAVATPRGVHRRDSIVGLLWPELNQERARAALRHSLYRLRGFLGPDAIVSRGDEDVALDFSIVDCDAAKFDSLLDAKQVEQALLLYEGDLLTGFFVRGAPEYERWLDGERARLRKRASDAACSLAESYAAGRRFDDASRWGRRALEIAPDDENLLRRVLVILDSIGDKSGALREYETFAQRMSDDYDAKPSAETVGIAARIKATGADLETSAPVPAQRREAVALPNPPLEGGRRRHGIVAALAAIALLTIGGYSLSRAAADDASKNPTIAILPFQVRGSPDVQYLREGMSDLLSIDVDGAGGMFAADPREIMSIIRSRGDEHVDSNDAREIAHEAGAQLYVTGSVLEAGGRITLSATLHDGSGRIKSTARTRSGSKAELFDLVDELARRLVSEVDGPAQPFTSLAGRTTRSIPALRSYLEGERELRAGRHSSAVDAFRQATIEDSTFALAWFRLSSAERWITEYDMSEDATERALRFGSALPPYALRLMHAAREMRGGNYAKSESLFVKSIQSRPGDPEGWFGLGDLHYHFNAIRGRSKGEARSSFERALALDRGDGESRLHLLELAAWEGKVREVDSLLTGLAPGSDFAVKWPLVRALIVGNRAEEAKITSTLEKLTDREVVRVVIHSTSAFPSNLPGAARVAGALVDPARSPGWRAYGLNVRAQIELARGRWVAARSDLTAMAALEPAAAIEYGAIYSLSPAARATTRDLTALRSALAGWDAKPTPPSTNTVFAVHNGRHETLRLYLLGLVNTRLGDTAAATRYADSLDAVQGDSIHVMLAANLARAVRARVVYARGDVNGALTELGQPWVDPLSHRTHYSAIFSQVADRYFMAELLEKSGRLGEAVRAYSAVGDYSTDGLAYLPMSHLRRGDIYLKMGDHARASLHYSRFVELWKDCDPNLKQLRDAAQAKVAQLRAGS